jgi:Tfp pilus assembly protein PilO
MQFPQIKNLIKNSNKDEFAKYLVLIPSYKAEKTQKFTAIFLTLIASIILGLFAINPTLSTIGNLQKQIDDDKFVESKLEEKINNLSLLQEKYASIQPDLPIIYNAVPQATEMPLIVGNIQSIAQNSNIKIDTIQTLEPTASSLIPVYGNYSSFEFEIAGKGNKEDIKTFIDTLSNFQRIISLESISLTQSKDINNTNLTVTIRGTAYFKE